VTLFAEVAEEIRTGELSFHASEFETSIMLALLPELVDMDAAERVDPPEDSLPLTDYDALGDNKVGWALTAADMAGLAHTGNVGDPTVGPISAGPESGGSGRSDGANTPDPLRTPDVDARVPDRLRRERLLRLPAPA
jgi:creatinine amidohydrolase/Fe(II)-dependent formamide hydrolase-like protein